MVRSVRSDMTNQLIEDYAVKNRYVRAALLVIEQYYPRAHYKWLFEHPVYNPHWKCEGVRETFEVSTSTRKATRVLKRVTEQSRQRCIVDIAIMKHDELVCVIEVGVLHVNGYLEYDPLKQGYSVRLTNLRKWLPKSVAIWWLPKCDLEHLLPPPPKSQSLINYRTPPPLRATEGTSARQTTSNGVV